MLGEENTYLYRTSLYLAASASAEFFADIALSPMESVKVRIQTSPVGTFPTTLREAAPKIYAAEGLNGFYKSLVPLWGRQIPYTMMKFACFERTVEAIYQFVVPKPRDQCTKGEQLIVTFAAGYIAGGTEVFDIFISPYVYFWSAFCLSLYFRNLPCRDIYAHILTCFVYLSMMSTFLHNTVSTFQLDIYFYGHWVSIYIST